MLTAAAGFALRYFTPFHGGDNRTRHSTV